MSSRNLPPDESITLNAAPERSPVELRARVRSSGHFSGGPFLDRGEEPSYSLNDYIGIILKRKRAAVLVFLVVLGLAAVYTYTSTRIYRSEATLEIDKDNVNSINNIGEALSPVWAQAETFSTQTEILRSRNLAEKLLDRMKLGDTPEFTPQEPSFFVAILDRALSWVSPPPAVQHSDNYEKSRDAIRKDQLVQSISSRVSAKRETNSRLLRVSMEAKDPEFGQKMLQNYIDIYLEQNLNKRRMVSREAGSWLTAELKRAEDKLVGSMAALVQFTNQHGMVSLEDNANHFLKFFDKAAEGLVRSKEHRVQLEAFQREGQGIPVLPTEVKPLDFQSVKEKLSLLESEYMQMREIYADDYPKLVMLRKQISFLKDKISDSEKKVVTAAVETAKAQEMLQQESFEKAKREAMDNNSLGVQYAVFKKEVETSEQIYRIMLQKSKEMELNIQIIGNNVNVVDAPTMPVRPVKPRTALNLLIGAFLGLVGGIMAALFLEHVDNSVHSPEDIEKHLGLPSLGAIPDINKFKKLHEVNGKVKTPELLACEAPKSPLAEAVRNVKASIFLSAPAASISTLVVSSAGPREGKTFTAVSIASVIASGNKKVLIVDADLRKPRVGRVFGQKDNSAGLTTLLTKDDVGLHKVVRRSSVPGLYYLSAGPLPPNPAGLLESDRMMGLLPQLKDSFDLVIFDSPPVVGFSDARILAASCDGVILVVKERYLPIGIIRQADAMISSASGRILGVVLNMASRGSSYYGGRYSRYYSYYHYYSQGPYSVQRLGRVEDAGIRDA